MCEHAKSFQSCLTLCAPMDYRPPGSSVHAILQARILEWAAVPSSRISSGPRGQTCVSYPSCLGRGFFIPITIREAQDIDLNRLQSYLLSGTSSFLRIISTSGSCSCVCACTHTCLSTERRQAAKRRGLSIRWKEAVKGSWASEDKRPS